ncbi:MAG: opacity family porin [Hyphomicrobiaceae bacterium]|nr:opacity family porin [Hyphomicrobiaceae bacterium]
MRLKTMCLSLGLALVPAATGAEAADWNSGAGSIKDGRAGGISVPAPIPVTETFKWYLRADVGGGYMKEPQVSERGMTYGYDRDPAEGPPFGMSPAWFNPDFDTFAVGGVGAGLYLTPRFRADVTVDVRTKSDVKAEGRYTYRGDPAIYDAGNTGRQVRFDGRTVEQTDVRATVALANLYWDLTERGSRFVPYIGLGAGFAVRSLDRRHTTAEIGTDVTDPANQTTFTAATFSGQTKAHQLAPAASATAGVGYTLGPGMVLDLNYRYTYIGEVDFSTQVAYGQIVAGRQIGASSRMTIGDTHEHTIRAGVRWNVW